ncbi:uncharacterized protein G2W53_022479 [Senna tora]|uniref:Uncharacterized protein n=1 Tax=Senna tora TaxID=362788 RepID=A0A834TPS4_9FABA|nr:uncharacterized protein G2W53_022479 [Senna tora]
MRSQPLELEGVIVMSYKSRPASSRVAIVSKWDTRNPIWSRATEVVTPAVKVGPQRINSNSDKSNQI